jgi:hypothetical protein
LWGYQIRENNGKVILAYPHAQLTPIAPEDVAAVAVEALTTHTLDNSIPPITGPHSLNYIHQIEILDKLRLENNGVGVEYEEVVPERWKELVAKKVGIPEQVADSILKTLQGSDGIQQPVSDEFEKLVGRKPLSFEEWARKHKDELFG